MVAVTVGITVATCTAEPLDLLLVVTTAVMLPTEVGRVLSVTVSVVAVAAVTEPTAPLVSVTVLLLADVSKPKPLMVSVVLPAPWFAVLLVTTGITEATCTAAPLGTPLTVTIAVRLPALGAVEKLTVSEVAVAEVTVPTAPLLNVTTLFSAVVLKFVPAIVKVAVLAVKLAVLAVTVGAVTVVTTVATFTVEPLDRVFVVTDAFRLPAAVGLVVMLTVSEVVVARVIEPTGPPTNVTVLLLAVGSKPKPLIMRVEPLTARLVLAVVTTGLTVATCTAPAAATHWW